MHARMVVADDDPVIRSLIGAALQGYTVFEAARGDDALMLVHRERPDLILLDVQMPGLDGLAVAQALAADPATAAIPVVLCSGAGSEVALAAQQLDSVRAFLPKPFSLGALRTTVEVALGHKTTTDNVLASAPQEASALIAPEVVHVLLVLEQPVLAAVVTLALAHVHRECRVHVVSDVATAIDVCAAWRPQLVIFDMALGPGALLTRLGALATADGIPGAPDVLGKRVPIVALARRGDLPAMLAALDGDVDDLLSVPCSPAELVARLLTVLQRTSSPHATLRPVLHLGEFELDLLTHQVRLGQSTVSLTALEQQLLYLLAANAGRALTRDEILDYVWGVDFIAEPTIVDQHVRTLRAKLQQGRRTARVIAAVPGRGYTFMPPAEGSGTATPRHPVALLPARRRRAPASHPASHLRPSPPPLVNVPTHPKPSRPDEPGRPHDAGREAGTALASRASASLLGLSRGGWSVTHEIPALPAGSDPELITLALAGEFLERRSARAWRAEVLADWRRPFPRVPAPSEWNRRGRWLWGAFAAAGRALPRP